MSMQRVINYVVSADGKVTCNGSRRPQNAGVQGDDGICTLNFDISAIYSVSAHYFFEFVSGAGSAIILSDEDENVTFDDSNKVLKLLLSREITADGGRVEVSLVEEVLDEEAGSAIEGNTYSTYITFSPKDGVIQRLKETAYGIFLTMRKVFEEANSKLEEGLEQVEIALEKINNSDVSVLENRVKTNEDNIATFRSDLSGHSQKNAEQDEMLASHSNSIGELFKNLNNHNDDTTAHNDIRVVIQGLSDRIKALHDCDDTTLDQTKEIVAYIKENRSILEGVTTSKVNVADIIDNLITNVSNKPLSAAQGVALKGLIDEVSAQLGNYATKEDVNFPHNIRISSFNNSSVSVHFEVNNGSSGNVNFEVDLNTNKTADVYLYKIDTGEGNYTWVLSEDVLEECFCRVYAFTYKVTNGTMHYLAVGNTVVLNKVVTIKSITCDGTAGTYTIPNLNLEYLLLDITSLAGFESNQSYRVYINGNSSYIVGYLNNLVHTTNKQEALVRVDLKNIQSHKGIAVDKAGISVQETKVGINALESISAITSVTIAPYNADVLIQSGSTITLKGREVQ